MRTGPRGAVLVDLDDTCYDQRQFLAGAFDAVAQAAAGSGIDPVALRAALDEAVAGGSDRGGVIDRALAAVGATLPAGPLVEAFRAHRPARLDPYPGVVEALAEIGGTMPVGLVTDGEPGLQRAKLAALGLEGAFAVVVVSDTIGRAYRKPHPAPFRAALALLQSEARCCAFVGDRPDKDIAGAARLGLFSVRVRQGEYAAVPDEIPPDAVVDDTPTGLRAASRAVAARTGARRAVRR